jgi:hypothetical protein
MNRTARLSLWSVFVIGALLVVMPFAISMPSKASAGQNMLDGFRPLMQPAAVLTAANYYNNDFVPLGSVATGGTQAATESPMLMSALATQLHMTSAQMQQFMGKDFPAMAQLLGSFPQMVPIFKQVNPGLAFYKPLIGTMQAQVGNYAKVDSLPDFNLFTWFFVVPGILLLLLSSIALARGREDHNLANASSATNVRDAVKTDKDPASV